MIFRETQVIPRTKEPNCYQITRKNTLMGRKFKWRSYIHLGKGKLVISTGGSRGTRDLNSNTIPHLWSTSSLKNGSRIYLSLAILLVLKTTCYLEALNRLSKALRRHESARRHTHNRMRCSTKLKVCNNLSNKSYSPRMCERKNCKRL